MARLGWLVRIWAKLCHTQGLLLVLLALVVTVCPHSGRVLAWLGWLVWVGAEYCHTLVLVLDLLHPGWVVLLGLAGVHSSSHNWGLFLGCEWIIWVHYYSLVRDQHTSRQPQL